MKTETNWEDIFCRNIRPKNFWDDKKNQRIFLEGVASKYNISKPEDWTSVTNIMIRQEGGSALLSRYNSSLKESLKQIFPGTAHRSFSS